MSTEKLSITLPGEVAAATRDTAARNGMSLSAYLAEAAREANRRAETQAIIAEIRAGTGEITSAEAARIEAEIVADEARLLGPG